MSERRLFGELYIAASPPPEPECAGAERSQGRSTA